MTARNINGHENTSPFHLNINNKLSSDCSFSFYNNTPRVYKYCLAQNEKTQISGKYSTPRRRIVKLNRI